MKKVSLTKVLIALLFVFPTVFAQSGGVFQIQQSVVSSGGIQHSSSGFFSFNGTIGQPVAGDALSGGIFSLNGGFWSFSPLVTSGAFASIAGFVTNFDGKGIANADIILTDMATGAIYTTHSKGKGKYRLDGIPVQQNYLLKVTAKRFSFAPDTRLIYLLEDLTDVNFVALP